MVATSGPCFMMPTRDPDSFGAEEIVRGISFDAGGDAHFAASSVFRNPLLHSVLDDRLQDERRHPKGTLLGTPGATPLCA
jgi:hypothetical protein